MSCLLIDPIIDGVVIKQHFKIDRDIDIHCIRVNIYSHNNTSADLILKLYQNDTLIATSELLTTSILNSDLSDVYNYGMVKFTFDSHVNLHVAQGERHTEYEWRLESVGGTETSFLAAVRQYEHKTFKIYYNDLEDQVEALNDAIEPYGFEIYDYKY